MTEETNHPSTISDLQETALAEQLMRYARGQSSDFFTAGQQMSGILPALGGVFMTLGNWPNYLANEMQCLTQRILVERRGAMAMHLRREAHLRYLREGGTDLLAQTEADIEALSPYYRTATIDGATFEGYLTFLLPYLGTRWAIKQLNQGMQNKHVMHTAVLRYPEKDSPIKHVTTDGYVEFKYDRVESDNRKRVHQYLMQVCLYREPPASFENAEQSSRSYAVTTFMLKRRDDTVYINAVSQKEVVVWDALERLTYVGGLWNIDLARFQRLIRSFLEIYGSVDPVHLEKVDGWFTGTGAPPIQMVLETFFEKLPENWNEGDEKPLLLEDHATAQRVFFEEGTRPLGVDVPRWLYKDSNTYLSSYFLGIESQGDLPIMVISDYEGHRLAYAEWQVFHSSESPDEAPTCRSSHFLLIIDKECLIVGQHDHRGLLKGRWCWTIKGQREGSAAWESCSVTEAAYVAIFTYLKQARAGYADALRNAVIWPQIAAGVDVAHWADLRFGERRLDTRRMLTEQGFAEFRSELSTYDYGRYFQDIFEVTIC